MKTFLPGTCPVNHEKTQHECADIEADEESDVHEMKGFIKRRNGVLYKVKWLAFPKKNDCTFEPYANFSEGARMKLIQFHINFPGTPRDHRVTSEP